MERGVAEEVVEASTLQLKNSCYLLKCLIQCANNFVAGKGRQYFCVSSFVLHGAPVIPAPMKTLPYEQNRWR